MDMDIQNMYRVRLEFFEMNFPNALRAFYAGVQKKIILWSNKRNVCNF